MREITYETFDGGCRLEEPLSQAHLTLSYLFQLLSELEEEAEVKSWSNAL